MLRATERGWTPDDLQTNGQKYKEEFWVAASKFWKSYIGTLILVDADHGEHGRDDQEANGVVNAVSHGRCWLAQMRS